MKTKIFVICGVLFIGSMSVIAYDFGMQSYHKWKTEFIQKEIQAQVDPKDYAFINAKGQKGAPDVEKLKKLVVLASERAAACEDRWLFVRGSFQEAEAMK